MVDIPVSAVFRVDLRHNGDVIAIIQAHPDPDSFSAALADAVGKTLRSSGADIESVDLYRCANGAPFPPLLDLEELHRKTSFQPEVQRQMDLVEQAMGFVIVHPDWWGGPPAILKGWIDRVLRPGTAYERPEGFGDMEPAGLLNGRRALVAVTGDSADPGPLEGFWTDRVWGFCGVESEFLYLSEISRRSARERRIFMESVNAKSADLIRS